MTNLILNLKIANINYIKNLYIIYYYKIAKKKFLNQNYINNINKTIVVLL